MGTHQPGDPGSLDFLFTEGDDLPGLEFWNSGDDLFAYKGLPPVPPAPQGEPATLEFETFTVNEYDMHGLQTVSFSGSAQYRFLRGVLSPQVGGPLLKGIRV
jgi:hypothetical protein